MSWSDSLLWSIRPDCRSEASELMKRLTVEGRGLHRDSMQDEWTRYIAKVLDMDMLPIDMHGERIAVVSVVGPLVNEVNPWTANYPLLTQAFNRLQADNNILAVVVRFKTPGGTVSGLAECCLALNKLSDSKLTIAQNDGGCYSAGYFMASHCGEIHCSATDHIGNIGTVISLDDYSELYKENGIRSVTKKTGPIKGLGIFGDPITDVQETFLQHMVDEHFAEFRNAVMSGRQMTDEQFAAVSDGRWWLGREAISNGIIDRISTLGETLQLIESTF